MVRRVTAWLYQIPPALQKMAASHRRNLMEAAELLGTGDREDLDRHERDLNNLKVAAMHRAAAAPIMYFYISGRAKEHVVRTSRHGCAHTAGNKGLEACSTAADQ